MSTENEKTLLKEASSLHNFDPFLIPFIAVFILCLSSLLLAMLVFPLRSLYCVSILPIHHQPS